MSEHVYELKVTVKNSEKSLTKKTLHYWSGPLDLSPHVDPVFSLIEDAKNEFLSTKEPDPPSIDHVSLLVKIEL